MTILFCFGAIVLIMIFITIEEKLAEHLGTYGRVLHCKLFPGQFCAFATFSNEREARCAVAGLDGKPGVNYQIIHASMAKSDVCLHLISTCVCLFYLQLI